MANLIPLDSEEEVDIDSIRSDFLREEVIYRAQVRQLADGLVYFFVCFNLAAASRLFFWVLGKRASQTRAANRTPPPRPIPDYDVSRTKQIH